jgi:hypothetical protein
MKTPTGASPAAVVGSDQVMMDAVIAAVIAFVIASAAQKFFRWARIRWRHRRRGPARKIAASRSAKSGGGGDDGVDRDDDEAQTDREVAASEATRTTEAETVASRADVYQTRFAETLDFTKLPAPLVELVRGYARGTLADLVVTQKLVSAWSATSRLMGTVGLTLCAPSWSPGADAAFREAATAAGLGTLNIDPERRHLKATDLAGMPGLTVIFQGRRADDHHLRVWMLRVETHSADSLQLSSPSPASVSSESSALVFSATPPSPSSPSPSSSSSKRKVTATSSSSTTLAKRPVTGTRVTVRIADAMFPDTATIGANADAVVGSRCVPYTDGRTLWARSVRDDARIYQWHPSIAQWRPLADYGTTPRSEQKKPRPGIAAADSVAAAVIAPAVADPSGDDAKRLLPAGTRRFQKKKLRGDPLPPAETRGDWSNVAVGAPYAGFVIAVSGTGLHWHHPRTNARGHCPLPETASFMPILPEPRLHVDSRTGVVHCIWERWPSIVMSWQLAETTTSVPRSTSATASTAPKRNLEVTHYGVANIRDRGRLSGSYRLAPICVAGQLSDGRVFFSDGGAHVLAQGAVAPRTRGSGTASDVSDERRAATWAFLGPETPCCAHALYGASAATTVGPLRVV